MRNIKKGFALALATVVALGATFNVSVSTSEAKLKGPIKKVSLSAKKMTLKVSQGKKLKVKNASKKVKVTWKTSKKSVVEITKKTYSYAMIKAKKSGSASVTAMFKASSGSKKAVCKVTVEKNASSNATSKPTETTKPTAEPTAEPTVAPTAAPTENPAKWVTTWGTAEEKAGTVSDDKSNSAMPRLPLKGTTVRQIIKLTTSGTKIRFRLSNQYGDVPVVISSMHIAKQVDPMNSTIDKTTDTVVTMDGSEKITIPVGKVVMTDPVDYNAVALENVAISMFFESAPEVKITSHRGARATTYQIADNNVSTETFSEDDRKTTTAWYFLADCSLWMEKGGRSVVCFGDSITDGYGTDSLGTPPDSYVRWGDYFAKRLQENEGTKDVGVINEGIGGNSILGSWPTDSGRDRFSRDLLEHDGVEYCIILFGVNDMNKLEDTSKYEQMLPEYQKMVKLCHDNNIKVYGAPILPFGTSDYYSENSEKVRTMINDWMRSTDSQMDGIIDFDKAVADPANPINILKRYTYSDGLHPYKGYKVMADAIDLKLFEK